MARTGDLSSRASTFLGRRPGLIGWLAEAVAIAGLVALVALLVALFA